MRKLRNPIARFLRKKRLANVERNWAATSLACDQLFVGRTHNRYKAHTGSELKLPTLPQRTGTPSIPQEAWDALYKPRHHMNPDPLVDVIIPITHDYESVIPCLYRVLSAQNETPMRVVLILNNHPDHKLIAKLRRLQELDLFDLLQNGDEEDILTLTNFAIQRHEHRDIVLLASNSDVPDHWLDRLRETGRMPYGSIASASPWTLGGAISGYPDPSGKLAPALGDATLLDAMCYALFDTGIAYTLHSASPLCVYIPREAISSLGLLPEQSDDIDQALAQWSATANEKGFDHAFAARVLLGTTGVGSHEYEGEQLLDPELTPMRQTIDQARLRTGAVQPILIIDGLPGMRPASDKPADQGALYLTPDSNPSCIRLGLPDPRLFPHLSFTIDDPAQPFVILCESLGLSRIVLRQLAGFPSRMLEYVMLLSDRLGASITIELADDYLICPSLLGVNKQCAPEDLESGYISFLERHPLDADGIPLWLWRIRAAQLLSKADSLHFATDDLKALYQRYYNVA